MSYRRLLPPTVLLLATSAFGATLHIPADYATIQAGISATQPGDTVLVAPGTYSGPGNRGLDFGGTDLVLRSTAGADATVIDCAASEADPARGFYLHNGETAAAVIDGFTIINGYVTGLSPAGYGGGICCNGTSPTLRNCIFQENHAWLGGGIHCTSSAHPLIENCTIRNNEADYGGGVYCIYDCTPTLRNCLINDNHANGNGGGMNIRIGSTPAITNCTIARNNADDEGGGIYCWNSAHPVLTNCTLTENNAVNRGGGLACAYSCAPKLTNCILWNDPPEEIAAGGSTLTYCDIQGGYEGEGNISASPHFRTRRGFDYVLWPGSPCMDSGTGADDGIDWSNISPAYGSYNTQAPDMGAYGGPEAVGWLE